MIDIYLLEFNNGQSYSDARHESVGVFTTPEKAMDYARGWNKSREGESWRGGDISGFEWAPEWKEGPPNSMFSVTWSHPYWTAEDYSPDREGRFIIFKDVLDPVFPNE